MNRRGFFRTLFAGAGAVFAPAVVQARRAPVEEDSYVIYCHPDAEHDIQAMRARDAWEQAYRRWRQADRPQATPAQVLDGDYLSRLVPVSEYGTGRLLANGFRIGKIDGIVRFIS